MDQNRIRLTPPASQLHYGAFPTKWRFIITSATVSALRVAIAYLLMLRQCIAALMAGSVKG